LNLGFNLKARKRESLSMAKRKTTRKKATGKKKTKKAKRRAGGGLTKMTYTVSPELQAVIGVRSCTRPQIVKKMWAYIKSRKCQDPKNRRMINPDAKLAEVFGSKRPVDMLKMAGLINKHVKK
jgi:chromatin remodeling complex protein RSC6